MSVIPAVCNPFPCIPEHVVESERVGRKRPGGGRRSEFPIPPAAFTGDHAGPRSIAPITGRRRTASRGVFPFGLAGQSVGLTGEAADPCDVLVGIGTGEVDHRPIAASPAVVVGRIRAPSGVDAEVPFRERHFILPDGEGIRNSHLGGRVLRLDRPFGLRRVRRIRLLVRAASHHVFAGRQFNHQGTFRTVAKLTESGRSRNPRVCGSAAFGRRRPCGIRRAQAVERDDRLSDRLQPKTREDRVGQHGNRNPGCVERARVLSRGIEDVDEVGRHPVRSAGHPKIASGCCGHRQHGRDLLLVSHRHHDVLRLQPEAPHEDAIGTGAELRTPHSHLPRDFDGTHRPSDARHHRAADMLVDAVTRPVQEEDGVSPVRPDDRRSKHSGRRNGAAAQLHRRQFHRDFMQRRRILFSLDDKSLLGDRPRGGIRHRGDPVASDRESRTPVGQFRSLLAQEFALARPAAQHLSAGVPHGQYSVGIQGDGGGVPKLSGSVP